MSQGPVEPGKGQQAALELSTAGVLLAVLAATGWMVLAAYWPGTFRGSTEALEVIGMIVLLSAALGLVSLVALLHTRR